MSRKHFRRLYWRQYKKDKTGLYGYVYDFSADYDTIAADSILDIHKCLVKKMEQHKMFGFIKKVFVVAMPFLVVMH